MPRWIRFRSPDGTPSQFPSNQVAWIHRFDSTLHYINVPDILGAYGRGIRCDKDYRCLRIEFLIVSQQLSNTSSVCVVINPVEKSDR
jgi:hypothetical protein